MTNLFSFLNPTPLSIQTPPELQAYGWTTVDIWCAPIGTALYALLTHAQPFWADLHSVLSQILGASEAVKPLDPEYARAICASFLSMLFVGRTVKNFGLGKNILPTKTREFFIPLMFLRNISISSRTESKDAIDGPADISR